MAPDPTAPVLTSLHLRVFAALTHAGAAGQTRDALALELDTHPLAVQLVLQELHRSRRARLAPPSPERQVRWQCGRP